MRSLCSSLLLSDPRAQARYRGNLAAQSVTFGPGTGRKPTRNRAPADPSRPPGSVQAVSDVTPTQPAEPARLRVLVGLVTLEAAAMGVLSVALLIGLIADRKSTQVGFVVAEVALAAVVAVALALVARGLLRGRRWVHGLGLTLQIFGLPFGVRLWQFGYWWAALPMLAVVVSALVLFFALAPDRGDLEEAAGPESD
jgi:hypothetical protein